MATGNEVDTYGWDTVFAIPVPLVNQAIVDHQSSPPSFSYADAETTSSATFGAWQISQGGSGKDVYLTLPLTNLSLDLLGSGKTFTFPSGTAIVEVQLAYLPQIDDEADPADGVPNNLMVRSQSTQVDSPPASLVSVSIAGADTVTSAVFAGTLVAWCNANLADFAHVFAVVNLNRLVDQGTWGFVTPNYTSYAYLDGPTLAESILAVLCMTGDRTGEDLAEQVSPNAIPSGSVAAFLISQARTLDDLVRPAICQAYPGLQPSDLDLSPDGTTLTLQQGLSVALAPVTNDGSTYYPQLTGLTVSALGSTLMLNSTTVTPVSPGITAQCVATHWYTINLGSSANGQALQFESLQTPDIVHSITTSPGIEITQIVIEIVAAIALLILTILTAGAALILAGLVIGLMVGASQIIPTLIETANTDDSPAIDLMLANAVSPITWTDAGVFTLLSANLDVAFQMAGDPQFT